MHETELLEQVISLARATFSEKEAEISPSTSASDIPGWNSLSHLEFLSAIENTYGVKFDLARMVEMRTIGDIVEATREMTG